MKTGQGNTVDFNAVKQAFQINHIAQHHLQGTLVVTKQSARRGLPRVRVRAEKWRDSSNAEMVVALRWVCSARRFSDILSRPVSVDPDDDPPLRRLCG
jgi:hypothetical protein